MTEKEIDKFLQGSNETKRKILLKRGMDDILYYYRGSIRIHLDKMNKELGKKYDEYPKNIDKMLRQLTVMLMNYKYLQDKDLVNRLNKMEDKNA